MVFADSTVDFWKGIIPYNEEWAASHPHGRAFLYSPVFSVLFTPFAFLPKWLGPFVWNLFNFSLYFCSIFTLPDKYTNTQKCRTFFYTFLILATTMLAFQFNAVVAYLFLFAYGLLERNKGFAAVLLIMISGFTKVYGIFQLGLLLCYPKFWKNTGYAVVIGIALFLLPLVNKTPAEFLPYYGEWIKGLTWHQTLSFFSSIFYIKPLLYHLLPYYRIVQIITISVLAAFLIFNRKKYDSFAFRAQALGVLMGWVILFSEAAESHTYVIALAGYMLWYWNHTPQLLDKILFWANFFLLVIVPIDILFPVSIAKILYHNLYLGIWIFLFTWLRMVYTTFLKPAEPIPETST